MAGFCRVSLLGNLGADPETRYTPNGAMNVRFNMAVTPYRRRTDTEDPKPTWYRVTAWDRQAEILDKLVQQGNLNKGSLLYVEGKLEPSQFTGNDGQTRWSFEVTMSAWEFAGGGRDQQNQGGGPGSGGYNQNQGQQNRGQQDSGNQAANDFDDDPGPSNIDDVPF
jgi:single-strand DNA-binding protein